MLFIWVELLMIMKWLVSISGSTKMDMPSINCSWSHYLGHLWSCRLWWR